MRKKKQNRMPRGHWDDPKNVDRSIAQVVEELGRMPTHSELYDRKLSGLSHGIVRNGGMSVVHDRLSKTDAALKSGRVTFRKGHWENFERVEDTVRPLVVELGRLPTDGELCERGLSTLARHIYRKLGGFALLRQRLGVPETNVRWNDFAEMERGIRPVIDELGHMPTQRELQNRKFYGAIRAIQKTHGGFDAVADRLGATYAPRRRVRSNDFSLVERTIAPIVEELGRMPTSDEIKSRGAAWLVRAIITHHGGFAAVEVRLGLCGDGRKRPKNFWGDFANVEASIVPVIAELGRMPRKRELEERGLNSLNNAIASHGGFPAVAARLGFGPVRDEDIAAHADALARIVPKLEVDPTVLWSRMKRSWTTRDLNAVVAAHAATGSLDAFRRLLDG